MMKTIIAFVIIAFGYLIAFLIRVFNSIRFETRAFDILLFLLIFLPPALLYWKFYKKFGKIVTSLGTVALLVALSILIPLFLISIADDPWKGNGGIGSEDSKLCNCQGTLFEDVPFADEPHIFYCIGRVNECSYLDFYGTRITPKCNANLNILELKLMKSELDGQIEYVPSMVMINGEKLQNEKVSQIDNNTFRITLDEKLLPGNVYTVDVDWYVKGGWLSFGSRLKCKS